MNLPTLPLIPSLDTALHPRRRDVSTEVTPDLLRRVAAAWVGGTASDDYARHELRGRAARLEHEQRPLPTVPGWHPGIVVERGGESCTGALLTDEGEWITSELVLGCHHHEVDSRSTTIRWAEQDGKTPGQTLWEAGEFLATPWRDANPGTRDRWERRAAAVLAAHGTPTLTDEDRAEEYQQGWAAGHKAVKPASLILTTVGEHPEPGTRGLLPVVLSRGTWCREFPNDVICKAKDIGTQAILTDPRPDGAM